MSLLAGVLTVSVAEAPAGATTTQAVSMTMTAGTFATKHGTPGAVPVITTPVFGGTETTKTGTFTGVTFKFPTQHNHTGEPTTSHPRSTETILVSGTKVTASVNTTGLLTIGATVTYAVHITFPITGTCTTVAPVHVILSSTAPYTTSAKTVTVQDSTIDVPTFTGCLASSELSTTFSGPGGELGLSLHGTLAVPPPALPTTTVLSATPASPQLTGTSVKLSATVKKTTGALATTATGTVTFREGTTTIGTATVAAGKASVTTTTLPIGTDQLTAVYGGGGGFKGSTASALTYVVKAAPTVTVSGLPKAAPAGTSTIYPFTVKITNPSDGLTYTHLVLKLTVTGLRTPNSSVVVLQYQDASGTWCTPHLVNTTTVLHSYFAGEQSTCTLTYPASFSSTPGMSTTVPLRVSFPTTTPTTGPVMGTATVAATLETGKCTSTTTTTCTSVAPLTGKAAPSGSEAVTLYPATPFATTAATLSGRKVGPTYPVRQTFDVGLRSSVKPTTSQDSFRLPAPRGTVTYAVTGTTVATSTLVNFTQETALTPNLLYGTADLSPGSHHLTRTYAPATYTGHQIYSPGTLTETFTVTTAPSGTPFTCTITTETTTYHTVMAYVTATGTVPKAALASSTVTASGVSATLVMDPVVVASYYKTNPGFTFSFSPTGTPVTSGKLTFTSPTNGKATELKGTASGLSTTVVLRGAPGTTTITAVSGFSSRLNILAGVTCTPATAAKPAPVGTTEIAGTTLTASPTGSATVGSPVTLTAHVYPEPATGAATSQVQFFDGTKNLGTTLVSTTGSSRGTASLTVSTLAVGSHSFTATWTGTPGNAIPFNVSAPLSYTVNPTPVTAPVVTTQPQSAGVKAGQTATFSAAAQGTSPSVQWQVSTDGGKSWSNITGATADTYSLTATKGDNGNQYRAVFTNSAGTATSNAATLYVTATGYWLTASNGAVYAYGNLPFYGSAGGLTLNKPIVGSAATPTGGGYWLVASDGGIFAYGSAQFYGSMGGKPLNAPIVGMAPTPTGKGYWEVASDGGIFAFGSAQFYGSMGGKALNQPVVGMAATPTGKGYDEVASDGGIFAFGAASFHGSTGSMTLNKPITAMATTPTGNGYWLVASDGGIFAFGSANFYGAAVGGAGAGTATSPVVGMAATTDGGGYLEVEANGRVVQFGDAALAGTALTQTLSGASIVGVTS